MKETNGLVANHWSGLRILSASDTSQPIDAIVGFPMRATRDSDLSIEDLRILICVGALAGDSESRAEHTKWIAKHTDLPEPIVLERLDRLGARGYLRRDGSGASAILRLVPDPEQSEPEAGETAAPLPPDQRGGRGTQASLHGDLLRRRTRRPTGSIEFDDPERPHPVVASLQEAVEEGSGGVSGFRFWLKTILDPEDVEVFSGWASRKSAEYRRLIRRFDRAVDDQQMESLLDVTLDLVNREKSEER